MSYIQHSLSESETLLYRARFPWFYAAGAWASLVALAACAALVEWGEGYGWMAVALLIAGVVAWLAIMLPIWTTEIGVTSQRLIFKKGLVWRTTQELQLRAVEEVNLQQGLLGRLFDFGKIELRGTGVDDIDLPSLAQPLALRRALQEGMAAATQPAVAAPVAPPPRSEISPSAA